MKKKDGTAGKFSEDAYSAERKANALNFVNRNDADKVYRPHLDSEWVDWEDDQKFALWKYTYGSGPMNKPLSGYRKRWGRENYVGLGNAKWSEYDGDYVPPSFSKFERPAGGVNNAKAIADMTMGIERSTLPGDAMLVRSSDSSGFAGLLENGNTGFSYDDLEKLIINASRNGHDNDMQQLRSMVEGMEFTNHSFMSTGIADDVRFGSGIRYHIYAPEGAHAVYAEPQSHYGESMGGSDEIYKPGSRYNRVGGEAEVVIQRGTRYRITKIEKSSYYSDDFDVWMEVVDQPDYFVTGYEHTHNGGLTSEK